MNLFLLHFARILLCLSAFTYSFHLRGGSETQQQVDSSYYQSTAQVLFTSSLRTSSQKVFQELSSKKIGILSGQYELSQIYVWSKFVVLNTPLRFLLLKNVKMARGPPSLSLV